MSMNLQGLIGSLLTNTLLFWESSSTRSLLSKNIIAHRSRNQLTSNIYALTLGCIIFLIVSANLQIESIASIYSVGDADIVIKNFDNAYTDITPSMFEGVLAWYADDINDFSYVTKEIRHQLEGNHTMSFIHKQNSE